MPDPLVLYSVNSRLAYRIAQQYYDGKHYVWCAPVFDGRTSSLYVIPPTSNPPEIYSNLREEVRRSDRHSAKIEQNKLGIMRGAKAMKDAGMINDEIQNEITEIVIEAEKIDFLPLIYIIPYQSVSHLVKKVPVKERAHAFSGECKIETLDRSLFDVIEEIEV